MPSVRIVSSPSGLSQVLFLNDYGVGRGQPNRRDDVLLVQFFLHRLWTQKHRDDGKEFGIPGKPPLAVDGNCGDQTIEAIKHFQNWFLRGELSDGAVSAMPKGQVLGTIHQKVFTIIGLNINYGDQFGKDQHRLLLNEPGFPGSASLRNDLFA